MSIKYKSIVPWGRSYEEYRSMFHLGDTDLDRRILGCADGPASFNFHMHRLGKKVVSADPLFKFNAGEIRKRIDTTAGDVLKQTYANREKFIWERIPSIEELERIRREAMEEFLIDYSSAEKKERYICASLPALPFRNGGFDLALCSHFLFLYTDNLSEQFHVDSVRELCRVAREVRIFPILDANANRSKYLDEVVRVLTSDGKNVREERVLYEFQRGGDVMLKIS